MTKIRKISELENSKNLKFAKSKKFAISKIAKIPNLENSKNMQF